MLAAHLAAYLSKRSKALYHKSRKSCSSTQPKGGRTTLLLTCLLIYLLGGRLSPVAFRLGSSLSESFVKSCHSCLTKDYLNVLSPILDWLKAITRAPGLLTSSQRTYSSLTLTVALMGNTKSKPVEPDTTGDEPASNNNKEPKPEVGVAPAPEGAGGDFEAIQSLPQHMLDPEGRVRGKKGSLDAGQSEIKKLSETDRNVSTQSMPSMPTVEHEIPTVKFKNIENSLQTGDLALLYRHEQTEPHFAIFVNHAECDKHFPLLFIKGKTKPMEMKSFRGDMREVRVITAVTRIFYGDYEKVAIRRLRTAQKKLTCSNALKVAEEVEGIEYTPQELMFINEASSAEQRSRIVCTFILAHVYKKLGILLSNPSDIRPETFQDALPLSEPIYIKLPPVKPGPLITGEPPLLAQIAKGMRPSPQKVAKPYTEVRETLRTGDLILFSGATSSGAIIKIFDGAIFSHIGIVLRPRYSSYVMVWESSTNKAGLVDVDTGSVRKGVELLPLRNKIFSGWYDHVAVRRLTGISDAKRDQIYDKLLEVRNELQGVPYEKSHLELILSAIDTDEKYLTFLKNHEEDLSSIFCSELVAHAYQEIGLLDKKKLSNEYTPDDFAGHRHLQLLEGSLEPEEYIELNFDYEKETFRQTSIPASKANEIAKQS